MAFRLADPCDYYGSDATRLIRSYLGKSPSGVSVAPNIGRWGGGGIQLTAAGNLTWSRPVPIPVIGSIPAKTIFSTHIRLEKVATTGADFGAFTSASALIWFISFEGEPLFLDLKSDLSIEIWDLDHLHKVGSISNAFVAGQWHHIEVIAAIGALNGTVEVWIDNVRRASLSGVAMDVDATPSTTTNVALMCPDGFRVTLDDLLLYDTSTESEPSARLGPKRMFVGLPTADTENALDLHGAATAHECVDDPVPGAADDATTYIESGIDGERALFTFGGLPAELEGIVGAIITSEATSPNDDSFQNVLADASAEVVGNVALTDVLYFNLQTFIPTMPSGADLTSARIATLRGGVKVVAGVA